jgi:hypothetical protein
MNPKPRILLIDIETSPNVGYTWGKWEQDVIEFLQPWFLLSVGWKWLDECKIHCLGLDDFRDYRKNLTDDSKLVHKAWELFNQADVIVAHNGNAFDTKKLTAKFIGQGLPPPVPYKTVDTLVIARKYFKFDSNKLDELGQYLKIGRKLPHTGFHMWKGCMAGDKKSWNLMKRYNRHDVWLLEQVYLKFRGWAVNHPNMSLYLRTDKHQCPKCNSLNVQRRGYSMLIKKIKQRFQCLDCSGWFTGDYVEKNEI